MSLMLVCLDAIRYIIPGVMMLYSSDVGTLRSPMDARKLSEPRLTMESVQSIMFALVLISKSNRRMTTGDTFFAGLVAAARD